MTTIDTTKRMGVEIGEEASFVRATEFYDALVDSIVRAFQLTEDEINAIAQSEVPVPTRI